MSGIEIRRVRVPEGAAVAELWDRMCREVADGGPLTPAGRENIRRMAEAAAWHLQTFCLVAVRSGEVTGFAVGRVDAGDGLLPGAVGRLEELWAEPGEDRAAVRRALAEAAIGRLLEAGPRWTLQKQLDAEDLAEQAFWRSLGFVPDMVVMSRYADDDA